MSKEIIKLKKTIVKLEKKLERSEQTRAHLEDIREKGQVLLKTINTEIEEARQLIEKQNKELKRLYRELGKEKKKSDNLLLNILPEEIAEELKSTNRVKPVYYDSATVLFTDFCGFTKIAEKMAPAELIQELDYCFTNFDRISDKFNLEKLKTIGDSYMCAGGIPVINKTHPVDVVLAAMEILTFFKERCSQKKKLNTPYWSIRIGIHTGPLVAGIIGKKKFAYDIWGDTVNIASRMESHGIPMKINLSQATKELITDYFTTIHRGKIELKNRGKVDMYVLRGMKSLNPKKIKK